MRSMTTHRAAFLLACLVGALEGKAELRLQLDPSALSLSPGSSRERVVVWIQNTGGESIPVLGGTLHFQIEEGGDTGVGPAIVGVDLPDQSNGLFRSDNASVSRVRSSSRLWSTILITQPETLPIEVWIPPFQRLAIATLDLDMKGVTSALSTWRLRMVGTRQGDSVLDQIDPADRGSVLPRVLVDSELVLSVSPPAASLAVGVEVLGDGRISISLPGPVSGQVRLERSTALEGQPWHPVESAPVISGPGWRWQLPADGVEPQLFYRVVQNP